MQINKVIVGTLQTNCYIISINNECIVIDPGDEYEKIKHEIGLKKVLAVIITHSHPDHIGALKYFNNVKLLNKLNTLEKKYSISKFNFDIIYTPGHKEDSISIYFKDEKCLFTGDFIFKDAIGRVDLDGGNYDDMVKSLKKISLYLDDTKIYPGHGESTILIDEKNNFKLYI